MVPSNHLILCCPFFPVPSIIPGIRSFPVSQLFASGSQSIEASASVLPMNIQSWFPLGLTVWPTFSPKDSQESSSAPQFKSINSSVLSLPYGPTLTSIRDHWKNRSFDYMDVCWQRHVFAFNTLSRFVIVFLPRSKRLLISWLQSLSTVILEPKKIVCCCFHFIPIYLPWSDGPKCHDLSFLTLEFKPGFSLTSFTFIRGSLVPFGFLPLNWYHLHMRDYWYFFQQS